VPHNELCEYGLVLSVVLGDFRIRSLILVGGERERLKSYAADAADLVVFGVDGEGEMPMDFVSSH
jgi:hypothetical protein